jgi:hypothetical protein
MMDLAAALASARRPELTVALCLRGDLIAQIQDLERQLDGATKNKKVQSLQKEMQDATVVLRLRGLSNPEWHKLVAEHEPRDGNSGDKAFGFNVETFFPALIKACLQDRVSDEQWTQLQDTLSSGQFEELSNAAVAVSRRKVNVPTLRAG